MSTFRTTPPPTYIPPSQEEMREAATTVGLGQFSPSLVADLCNVAAGGSINPPSSYRADLRDQATESLPAEQSSGWALKTKGSSGSTVWSKNRHEVIEDHTNALMRYHQNVCDFVDAVDIERFPGTSPLQKAMSLLKLLSKQQGGSGSGGGTPLPIFADNDHPEGVADQLHDTMDMVDDLSEEELDMLDPDGQVHDVSEDGDRTAMEDLSRLKVAEDLHDGANKRVMLDISRHLDQFTKLQVRRQKRVEQDPAGEEVRQRQIKHLGELPKVAKTAWAMRQQNPTYFLYQAVTRQLPMRERVTRIERKQAIFILVDGSGSMRTGQKHWRATGVVMNRLKAVIAGDAEVYVAVFDTQMKDPAKASNPEEARDLIMRFQHNNFTGGGTDIAAAVKAAHSYIDRKIKAGEALYRPEVVVLTDEDRSSTGLKKSDIPGTTVHGFAMEVANPSLVAFAQSTGGVGIDRF